MKKELREWMIQKRKSINPEDKNILDQKIVREIRLDSNYKKSKCVAIFYPMANEINLLPLLKDDKIFVLPKVIKNEIHFFEFNQDTELFKSHFGVMEPNASIIMDEKIDYMITPALAISKDLYRIGYGKGFYDRFLMRSRPTHVVGVIYDFQEVEKIETNEHDQKLDRYIKVSL